MVKEYRINERIRSRDVRLIGDEGEQLGVMTLRQAITMARENGLDVVEVAPNVQPPVCRILDYGKFKYEQAKKEKDARKHQKVVDVRQIRLRPKTGDHDIMSKISSIEKLLEEGDKVKVLMIFRGREITHPQLGRDILAKMLKILGDKVVVEKPPMSEGNSITMLLAPKTIEKPAVKPPPAKPPPRETQEKVPAIKETKDAKT